MQLRKSYNSLGSTDSAATAVGCAGQGSFVCRNCRLQFVATAAALQGPLGWLSSRAMQPHRMVVAQQEGACWLLQLV
jgi:hypothetical protein